MLLLRMATRNLTRQVGRNALSMVSIVMGVFVIVLGWGAASGLDENAIRGQIDSVSGHVLVVPGDYPTTGFRHPVDGAWVLGEEHRAWLDAQTTAWTPRLVAAPRAIKGRESMRVRLIGGTEADASVFPRDDWTLEGRFPDGPGEAVVATGPARLLDLAVDDVLTLEVRTVDGAINAMRYTVTGIVGSANPLIDNVMVWVPIASADELLAANGRITHLAALVRNRDLNGDLAAGLAERLPETEVRTWQGEVAQMLEIGGLRRSMFGALGLALLGMAATGIANTVLMAAFERVQEIGTLRSMGLQRSGIVAMFALEGLWMGVLGGLIGTGLAGAICAHYARDGIDLAPLIAGKADMMSTVPMASKLYLGFSPAVLGVAFLTAVVVSVAASIYPAISASRISPAEAVRPS